VLVNPDCIIIDYFLTIFFFFFFLGLPTLEPYVPFPLGIIKPSN
jgi:hypothetical protein